MINIALRTVRAGATLGCWRASVSDAKGRTMRTTWPSIVALSVLFCAAGSPPRLGALAKPPPPQGGGPPPLPVLKAGPGQSFDTPCVAIAAALPGQEIDVSPGTYTDSCEINTAGITLRGVGGQPKIDLSATNHPADYKGIYVVSADNVTIQNLELTGAHIDDSEGGNAAALRITGKGVVVHGCYIHDNQNGVLAAPLTDGGLITIQYTELSHNGLGDACDQGGCVHNVYVSQASPTIRYDETLFQFNWSHDLASDTADKGHLLKSRSRTTAVLYNRITGETGHDSYEVDIPNGGQGVVLGNVIEKGPNADNSTLLAYGEEGLDNSSVELDVISNTFVNDFTGGTFISAATGAVLTAHNNILYGPGMATNGAALSADNLTGIDPLFVALASYDYHLQAGSPAIGKAVALGPVGPMLINLTPDQEYVQPLLGVARLNVHDLGAFEYGTDTRGATQGLGYSTDDDAGNGPALDAGAISVDAAAPVDAVSGIGSRGAGSTTCGCEAVGRNVGGASWLAGLALAVLMARRRAR
ncbi:MAG TPA: hypothetical protein VH044_17140 [Polyangiaceae bacterium]|jgi:hypothetical protein|nr:hypothetical protein [Polyangiaceae bacterium]